MEVKTFTGYTPIAEGQSGSVVSTTLNSAMENLYGSYRYIFTQADSTGTNEILYNHNLGTKNVSAKLYDSNGIEQNISGLFTVVDNISWHLQWHTELEGTYFLVVNYKKEDS
jgi:hypothetical protein